MKNRIWNEILERIYPSDLYCICCSKIIDGSRTYRLCDDCMESMKWATGRLCDKCGKPLSVNDPCETCFNCREHLHSFDRGYTCCEYGTNERSIVYSMKYDDRSDIAGTIADMMADRMLALYEPEELAGKYDLLVPVPVSDKRKGQRGYNQAALIAAHFSENTGIEYRGEILQRMRETKAMKGLAPDERKANIRGSFAVRKKALDSISGAECLVVDDIYTTGATIDEIASVLKAHGASTVDFLSFANGADVVK